MTWEGVIIRGLSFLLLLLLKQKLPTATPKVLPFFFLH